MTPYRGRAGPSLELPPIIPKLGIENVVFGLHRAASGRRFSDAEVARVGGLLAPLVSTLSRLRLTEELEALRGAHTAAVPSLTTLTRREHEIAGDVADGLANKHIARRRGVSVHTVENHLRSIFRKTGVDSRTKLALATGVDGSYPIDRRVVDFDHGARPHATTSLAESAAGRHRTTEPLVPSM